MPLVNRGVDQLTTGSLHDKLGSVLVPMEFLVVIIAPILIGLAFKMPGLYKCLPDTLFKFILMVDWLYAMVLGPLRWLPGNAVFEYVSFPTTKEGCMAVVWLDTFCQLSIVFTNTAVVACVFYMVYFKTFLSENVDKMITQVFLALNFIVVCCLSTATMLGESHNYVGWCTADSVSAILKLIAYFLALVIQITMILPTLYMTWDESNHKSSRKTIPEGFFFRFMSSFCTQLLGIFPVICVEFLGLARKPVPENIMYAVIILLPLSQIWDCVVFSMKLWPMLCGEFSNDTLVGKIFFCIPWTVRLKEEEEKILEMRDNEAEGKKKKKKKKKKSKKQSTSIFARLPFWLHLVLTLAIPFILLSVVAAVMILNKNDIVVKSELIRQDIVLTSLISNYVHETQKERGATGVFMGSGQTKFKCEIKSQYTDTNVQKNILQTFLNTEFRNVKLVTKLTFLNSLIYMLNIESHRVDVQTDSIAKGVALAWYTTHNMFFVGIVALVCRESTLEEQAIAHLIYSNLAFVSAKEKAGVERAKGAVAFAEKQWTTLAAYQTFVELVAAQNTHLYFFETYVSTDNLIVYEKTLEEEVSRVSQKMRIIALDADEAVMLKYEGSEWFWNMTGKLGLVRSVEAVLAGQLRTESEKIVNSTTSAMMLVVGTLAFVLIIDGLMILGLARTSDHLKRFQIGDDEEKNGKKKKKKDGMFGKFMKSIYNLGFVYQVLVPVLLCAFGLIGVSWMLLRDQVTDSQLAASTYENMNLQFFMSNFVHETQKERGATGVYMGSSGKDFNQTLRDQIKLCDKHKVILYQFLDTEYIDYENLRTHWTFVRWMSDSYKLEEMRHLSLNLLQKTGVSLGYYTQMNKHIVGTVSEMAFRGSSKTVEARLLAYLGYMYMKEKAGNERAVGTLGMGTGMWPTRGDWRKFIQLVAIQNNAFLYFEQFGSSATKDKHIELSGSIANQILGPWQAAALTNDSVVMISVDSGDWFHNMTAKINEWRIIEEDIAIELNSFFNALEDETTDFVTGICIMIGSFLVFTVHIGIKGIRLLLRSNAYNLYQDKLKEEKLRARQKAAKKSKRKKKK